MLHTKISHNQLFIIPLFHWGKWSNTSKTRPDEDNQEQTIEITCYVYQIRPLKINAIFNPPVHKFALQIIYYRDFVINIIFCWLLDILDI